MIMWVYGMGSSVISESICVNLQFQFGRVKNQASRCFIDSRIIIELQMNSHYSHYTYHLIEILFNLIIQTQNTIEKRQIIDFYTTILTQVCYPI